MKINEIINEGIWDTIKAGAAGIKGAVRGGVAGAKSAYQAQQTAQQQQQGAKDVNQYANEVIRAWNEYTGGTGDKDVKFWASRFFDANLADFPLTTVDLNNPTKVRNFLNSVVKVYKSGMLKPVTTRKGKPYYTPTAMTSASTVNPAPKVKSAAKFYSTNPSVVGLSSKSTKTIPSGEPVYMGGQRLDPRDPNEKAIIDRIKAQGL
jgi:hypothetical protein